ncbi:MAG: hypothetical protein JXA96_07010 [Sedimentisphaerales bacterium]|nr:hypothetical protein [Sedimentisphaerales bacterium]
MFSITSLVCAGLMLMLCANQWLEYAHNNDIQDDSPSIVEIFQNSGNIVIENEQEKVSPLVSQAGEFTLIIDPPKPPEVVKKEEPLQPKITQPVTFAPRPSARFKLLSTSYNRDRPEDSVALINEPGKGEHWAKVGDFIGNFVLEKIEHGTIIYRYGSQVSEMAVEINAPVRIVQESVPPFGQGTQGRRQVDRKSILFGD